MTLLFLFGSLEYIDDNNIELRSICRLPGKSRVDILNELELQTKLTLLVFVHFKIEALFSDILLAVDSTYNVTNKFLVKAKNLLERLTINEEHEKYDCYKVMSIIRNSLHNNSNNMN